MSNSIKETPVLKGKHARAFIKNMNDAKNIRVDPKERERITKNYNALAAIAKF